MGDFATDTQVSISRKPRFTRREFLQQGKRLALFAALGLPHFLIAADPDVLDVAYAGSMGSLMEGPVKTAAIHTLGLTLHGRAQGSNALAQLIAGGSIWPDVFVSITPGPMQIVLKAGKSEIAWPIAHTEMVISYSPKSRFSSQFAGAAKGQADVWQILQQAGLRFGRTDPVTDPQGRNIIFTVMLAAKNLQRPNLVEKILGPVINPKQIFTEPTVQARLQSGELDAASSYKIQPGAFHLPYVSLPATINLSGENVASKNPDLKLQLNGKTYTAEPLIYYAAALSAAPNKKGASAFIEWLKGREAQSIFRQFEYDSPGEASPLRA